MVYKKSIKIRNKIFFILIFTAVIIFTQFASANIYVADLSFTVPESVYAPGERIEIKGSLVAKNYSDNGTIITGSMPISNALINITISNSTSNISSFNITTDADGLFYSRSNFYTSAPIILSPNISDNYVITAIYKDPNNASWFSDVEIRVVNQTIDEIRVSTDKAVYNPSENMVVLVESLRIIGERSIYVSGVSVNGSVRNSTSKAVISSFNCTTANDGKCSVSVNAPSVYGDYIIEVNDFKAFSGFSVVPFSASIYMKDNLGKSYKSTYSVGEKASVEIVIVTNNSNEIYTFSGCITDTVRGCFKVINTTTLNSNNSYTNRFVFTIDGIIFPYGRTYYARVDVSKIGDGSISLVSSFEVKDWSMTVTKKEIGSGFEYDYSVFPNKTIKYEIYPKYRINGSVIQNINSSSFEINLTDRMNNNLGNASVVWNATCGTEGCYEFSLISPSVIGEYTVYTTLSYSGDIQKNKNTIYVIDTITSAQATNVDGDIKELFGTNEYAYISLSSYNTSSSSINLSDAEIFLITYMNGSDISYVNVSTFALVNASNNAYEWAWNSTNQRFKLDVPKIGGVYSVLIFAQNRSVVSIAKFIVNPYDICSDAKNTVGSVSGGSNTWYVRQFKTTDTIYFEIKVVQASNPLGRATVSNTSFSNGSSNGLGSTSSSCNINTQTQQVVNNASISILRVINTNNGGEYLINTTQSVCVSMDSSGGYTCTVAPLSRWDGGIYAVEMSVVGPDGSSDIVYGIFEAKAFYLYGYPNIWQNMPSNNITINLNMYEAGRTWWSGGSGLSGTLSVEKVEWMGTEGDWIWPPVDSGYNISKLNSTYSVTNGRGSFILPATYAKSGYWKTGNYRIILKGTDTAGNNDYGYAWFSVRLWDVYGMPIDCTITSCNYKTYFNSKENISLYIKIGNAGSWYNNDNGGQNLGGNVTIGIKKVQDCRKWPCKELNSSEYSANSIVVNASSPWYWYNTMNSSTASNYMLTINKIGGSWGTGWYSVLLNVNGTETGYAYFNTIAFYVDIKPTSINGTNLKYNIKPRETMYFNTSITKNYVYWGYSYNFSDSVNATIDDVTLRSWDSTINQNKEYNYPENINITLVNQTNLQIIGNALLNLSYLNGSWPTGYYSGELLMRNSENETSTGWFWFGVQPFRVDLVNNNNYETDYDSCINATLSVKEPDWSVNDILNGSYSITSVYENIWAGGSSALQVFYTNYTNSSFNGTLTTNFCPNNGSWGGGSWGGGYHYLNIVLKDNINNDTQTGWLSFRAIPFKVTWTIPGGYDKRTNENVNASISLTGVFNTSIPRSGNLSRIYQWRYDSSTNYMSVLEEYSFVVYTNSSSACSVSAGSTKSCFVNGSATVVITVPSRGWKVSSNYLYSDWTSGQTIVQDYSGIYFNGMEAYNGWFDNVDTNGNWKNSFAPTENVTLRLNVRNISSAYAGVNLTSIQYAIYENGCYSSWCASFTEAISRTSIISGGSGMQVSNGSAIFSISPPSGGWSKGSYTLKLTVSGISGISAIEGGTFTIKDFSPPNITINLPAINQSVNSTIFLFNATTTENSVCTINTLDYGSFYSWLCSSTNSSTLQSLANSCNKTYYGLNNNTIYQTEYVSRDWYYFYNGSVSYYSYSGASISTGGTTHTYSMNVTNWLNQDYTMYVSCYDEDNNNAMAYAAFHLNRSTTTVNNTSNPLNVTIISPLNITYGAGYVLFNVSLNEDGYCEYTLNSGATNNTMQNSGNRSFTATNNSIADGTYIARYYCNDTSGNRNDTTRVTFTKETVAPSISITSPENISYNTSSITVYFTSSDINGISARWFFNGTANITYTNITTLNATQGSNTWIFYSNDTAGNTNSTSITFFVDSIKPLISYGNGTANNSAALNQTWIYINVTWIETNFANITFNLFNLTSLVNSTFFATPAYTINWTGLAYTNYTYNVTIRDILNNLNSTETRRITLSNI